MVRVCVGECDVVLTLSAGTVFHFNCLDMEDQNDASIGLIDGDLSIPGALLRTEVCPLQV
jgi:hypothetical protein